MINFYAVEQDGVARQWEGDYDEYGSMVGHRIDEEHHWFGIFYKSDYGKTWALTIKELVEHSLHVYYKDDDGVIWLYKIERFEEDGIYIYATYLPYEDYGKTWALDKGGIGE